MHRSVQRRFARAAVVAGVVTGSLLLTSAPAGAHEKTCELPWDPSQGIAYTVCVVEATVHNNVWHAIFP